jgi:hypothetical protein
MTLEVSALIVSIVAAGIAIASFVQAIVLRRRTKRETEEQLSFITHLVINSAADPDTVRRMLEDYNKVGEWRAKVSRRSDGKYGLDFKVQVGGEIKPSGKLGGRKV